MILLVLVTGFVSALLDNVTTVLLIARLKRSDSSPGCSTAPTPARCGGALALGADFGGNLTAVGASPNVVMLGIARRSDSPISFWEFTRKRVLVTAMWIGLAALYLWLRYFVLT